MNRTAAICVIAITTIFSEAAGKLITVPRNTESRVGDTTYFNCSTDLESADVVWYHGEESIDDNRFTIDVNASYGSHNLVIQSVEPNDAGEYICADDSGLGQRRSAQLIVIDNDPECQSNMQPDGVIGQNVFNITPDEVQLQCIVTYHGSIPPQMEWVKVGENSSIRENITWNNTYDNRLIHTLKLTGDVALDNSSYVCHTTRSTQNQYMCNSETIKVLYIIGENTTELAVIEGDKITCTASSSLSCVSQWYHKNDSYPSHCNQSFTPRELGEYTCKVKCNVRGSEFTFAAVKAVVLEKSFIPKYAGISIAFIGLVLTIVAVFGVDFEKVKYISFCNDPLRRMGFRERIIYYEDFHAVKVIPYFVASNVMVGLSFLLTAKVQDAMYVTIQLQYCLILVLLNPAIQILMVICMWICLKTLPTRSQEDERRIAACLEKSPIEYLLARKEFVPTDDKDLGDDQVAAEEVELLHKIKANAKSEEKAAVAMAILDGQLFIARKMTSTLEVYDCSNFNLDPTFLHVPDTILVSAFDMCSCERNQCLYIKDQYNFGKVISKFGGNGDFLGYWITKGNEDGFMSVTADGNIIVTDNVKHRIYEYSYYGYWLRTIRIPGCNNPWHAIKLDTDRFIVCHGTILDSVHRVCLVEEKNVKKSFGPGSGIGASQLNIPYYLAAVSNGWVVVADLCNHRLLLLDSNLELIAKIVPKYKQRFLYPQRVCLDENLGLLMVVIGAGEPKERRAEDEDCLSGDTVKIDKFSVFPSLVIMRKVENGNIAENCFFNPNPNQKTTIIEDKDNSCPVAPEDNIPTENSHLLKKGEEGKLEENGYDKKTDLEGGGGSINEIEKGAAITENNSILPRKAGKATILNVEASKRIEEDCRILIFDIKPLLQKYIH